MSKSNISILKKVLKSVSPSRKPEPSIRALVNKIQKAVLEQDKIKLIEEFNKYTEFDVNIAILNFIQGTNNSMLSVNTNQAAIKKIKDLTRGIKFPLNKSQLKQIAVDTRNNLLIRVFPSFDNRALIQSCIDRLNGGKMTLSCLNRIICLITSKNKNWKKRIFEYRTDLYNNMLSAPPRVASSAPLYTRPLVPPYTPPRVPSSSSASPPLYQSKSSYDQQFLENYFTPEGARFLSETYPDFADMARKQINGTLSTVEWANYLRNKEVPRLLPGDRGLSI